MQRDSSNPTVDKVGVIGAGTMGSGIAQVFAAAGYAVRLHDQAEPALEQAFDAMDRSIDRLIKKGSFSATEKKAVLARVSTSARIDALADADVVIESATENVEVKLNIFQALDNVCKPLAVLATNTSSISVTRLAAATRRGERVIGMHFSNPVPIMPLTEVITALQTKPEIAALVSDLAHNIGKTPVMVRDSPGFVTNRILMPMINEAVFCLYEGIASARDIDRVMQLGMKHPMGPLALADLIGLDTCMAIMQVLSDGFGDPKYRVCPLLKQMVDAGHWGRKVGKGFYDYSSDGS